MQRNQLALLLLAIRGNSKTRNWKATKILTCKCNSLCIPFHRDKEEDTIRYSWFRFPCTPLDRDRNGNPKESLVTWSTEPKDGKDWTSKHLSLERETKNKMLRWLFLKYFYNTSLPFIKSYDVQRRGTLPFGTFQHCNIESAMLVTLQAIICIENPNLPVHWAPFPVNPGGQFPHTYFCPL